MVTLSSGYAPSPPGGVPGPLARDSPSFPFSVPVLASGNLDKQTGKGSTALHYCCLTDSAECLKLLLRGKATISIGEPLLQPPGRWDAGRPWASVRVRGNPAQRSAGTCSARLL